MIETVANPRAPSEPQFEHVVPAAALDGLVSGVVARVVVLVALEQVARAQPVALLQETLPLWNLPVIK